MLSGLTHKPPQCGSATMKEHEGKFSATKIIKKGQQVMNREWFLK